MTDEAISPQEEEANAIARLGATHDGALLHRYLRRILENCRVTEDSGALQRNEGARIVARDLMVHLDKGEATRGRSSSAAATQPVLTARAGIYTGGSGPRGRAGARRVERDPAVDEFIRTEGGSNAP